MKTIWRDTLALTLVAVYLAAAGFGHCFHDHGDQRHDACVCDASCHGHSAEASHRHAATDRDGRPAGGWQSTASDGVSSDHVCPVCGFYSHHSVPVAHVERTASSRLIQPAFSTVSSLVGWACPGPQQPRAPPWFA
ncbi:MAG: hypothetical protein JW888_11415 [Pirellulales bacterium]|nr:hypothetical protein [Pirellulales bacterium]